MTTQIDLRQLGAQGPRVFPLALGCMGMSGMYGPADEAESIATIHAALDRGVTLLDTGDFYGAGPQRDAHRPRARGRRDKALLSVKFGALRAPDGGWLGVDARPAAVKNFLAYSLTRLGVDHIDIYRPARLDPAVPIEDTDRRHRRPREGRLRPRTSACPRSARRRSGARTRCTRSPICRSSTR